MDPDTGTAGTSYYFRVKYGHPEGRLPSVASCELRRDGKVVRTLYMWPTKPYPTYDDVVSGLTYRTHTKLKRTGTYEYRFRFRDRFHWAAGAPSTWSSAATVSGTTGRITSLAAMPTNAGAQVTFTLSSAAEVSARVLNLAGRPVRTLCRGMECEAGTNTLVWNGRSDAGVVVPRGTYLVEVTARDAEGGESRMLGRVGMDR